MREYPRVALLAGLCICVSAAVARAQSVPSTVSPAITLSITLPDGSSKDLSTHEGGLATVTVNGREYGFRPTMHDDAGLRMTVTLFDMGSPSEAVKELSAVEVRGGGSAVGLKTSPAFKVQARLGPPRTTS